MLLRFGHLVFYRILPLLSVTTLVCVLLFKADSYCTVPNLFASTWSVPLCDCNYCAGVTEATVFSNEDDVTASYFMNTYAFGSGPVLFKNASMDWPATGNISYELLRDLYISSSCHNNQPDKESNTEGYFTYKASVFTMEEFLSLSEAESNNGSWYISWHIGDTCMLQELHHYFKRPYFLPFEQVGESNHGGGAIYIGTPGPAASLHIDYFGTLTWQAQLSGAKTWHLFPMAECEHVCVPVSVTVEQGDIIVMDNHRWYHATYVHKGKISVSYGEEMN